MRTYIVLILLLFLSASISGQIIMQPVPVNQWITNPAQILRIDLINQGRPTSAVLNVEVKRKDGGLVLGAVSLPLNLPAGMLRYEPDNVASINYYDQEAAEYMRLYASLPNGEYNFCYQLKMLSSVEPLLLQCITVAINSMQSLTLVAPFDGEEISFLNPVLVWSIMGGNLITTDGSHYELKLGEWKSKYSRERALEQNTLLHIKNLEALQHLYSPEYPPLVPGAKYVWQVLRVKNGVILDRTSIWSFKVNVSENIQSGYVNIGSNDHPVTYHCNNDMVRIRFDETYTDNSAINIILLKPDGEEINLNSVNTTEAVKVADYKKTGFNQLEIDLKSYHLKNGSYKLRITDGKQREFYLNVIIN